MMTTRPAANTSLEIKRFINAPRARVYAAWTDPAQLKEWFGPVWVRTCELVAEPRVGGRFRWDVINCDGKEVTIQGEYREIDPARKSFSPGNIATTSIGKIKSASSRWNSRIATAEPSYD